MVAIEIETAIVNHRIDIQSDLLPASAQHARVILMYAETRAAPASVDILALARAAQAKFPKMVPEALADEVAALRGEWSREP